MYLRVIKELKYFTHCDCAPEQEEHQTTKAQEMWWRDPQNKLQCESVQLSQQKLQSSYQLHAVFLINTYLHKQYFCNDDCKHQQKSPFLAHKRLDLIPKTKRRTSTP